MKWTQGPQASRSHPCHTPSLHTPCSVPSSLAKCSCDFAWSLSSVWHAFLLILCLPMCFESFQICVKSHFFWGLARLSPSLLSHTPGTTIPLTCFHDTSQLNDHVSMLGFRVEHFWDPGPLHSSPVTLENVLTLMCKWGSYYLFPRAVLSLHPKWLVPMLDNC